MNSYWILSAASGTPANNGNPGVGGLITMVLPLALLVLFFYFFMIRPEKKRSKEMQDMLNNIQVADEVVTNGGIIGRVLSVKEDTVLIETGSDRTKIRVLKNAIAKNNTVHEMPESAAEAKPSLFKNKKKDDKPKEIK